MIEYLETYDVLRLVQGLGFYVKDLGLIESAVARPQTNVFGLEAYETLELKAAALVHSMVKNHALMDGNKSTTWVVLNAFLFINELNLEMSTDEGLDFILGLATDKYDIEQAAAIIRKHLVNR